MNFTVKELSNLINGAPKGDLNRTIDGAAGLSQAQSNHVSFVKDSKNNLVRKEVLNSKAGVIIVPKGYEVNGQTVIEVEHPMQAFADILSHFKPKGTKFVEGIHPTAVVSENTKIGKNVTIGPYCVIEEGSELGDGVLLISHVYVGPNSKIGALTKIYSHVTIRENTIIGISVTIDGNTVIGSDGYGFFPYSGAHHRIPQIGNVVIEDQVEIGAGATIDRAMMGSTILKKGTKLDNLVHVAHNVSIGENTLLAAQVGIAGSAEIGNWVVMGGQVGVADHAKVGDKTQVGAQSGIKGRIKEGSILFGSPGQNLQDELKQVTLLKRLPDMFKTVKKLAEKCGL